MSKSKKSAKKDEKINGLVIEYYNAQDVNALKEYAKDSNFNLYAVEDLFSLKKQATSKKERLKFIMMHFKFRNVPKYLYRVIFPTDIKQDDIRRKIITYTTFE